MEGKRDSLHGFGRNRLRGASAALLAVCTGKLGDQAENSWTQVGHSMTCLLWTPKDCQHSPVRIVSMLTGTASMLLRSGTLCERQTVTPRPTVLDCLRPGAPRERKPSSSCPSSIPVFATGVEELVFAVAPQYGLHSRGVIQVYEQRGKFVC